MTNASSWALQYFFVVLVAFFAGPLLSKLPAIQAFPLTLLGLNGQQTIRLVIEGTGTIIQSAQDNRSGSLDNQPDRLS